MGFTNELGSAGKRVTHYIKFKDGQFLISERREGPDGKAIYVPLEPYRKITNILIQRIAVDEDEYEGRPYKALRIIGKIDPGSVEEIVFQFKTSLRSYVAGELLTRLSAADLNAPMDWAGAFEKAGSQYKRADGSMSEPLKRDVSRILIYQNDQIVRRRLEDTVPPVERRIVDGEETLLYSKRVAWAEQRVRELAERLSGGSGQRSGSGQPRGTDEPMEEAYERTSKPAAKPRHTEDEPATIYDDDDIPF